MERNLNPKETTINESQGRGSVAWLTYGGYYPRLKRACGAREPGFKGGVQPRTHPGPGQHFCSPLLNLER